MREKSLLIISTGGTIAQTRSEGEGTTVNKGDQGAKTFAEALGKALAEVNISKENVHAIQIMDIDSSNLVPRHWEQMIDAIVDNYNDHDMFLLTHGTNTMGYTTAALSFALENLGKPVVVTGSQVPLKYAGTDALSNLEKSVMVAAYPDMAGVITVFGSRIIIGTRTKKMTEFGLDAFASFKTSPLGEVGSKGVHIKQSDLDAYLAFYGSKARFSRDLRVSKNFDMHIASFTEFPGMTSEFLIDAVKGSNIRGIVMRTSGAGDPNVLPENKKDEHENLRQAFQYLSDNKIPVVITTHAPDGVASMDINTPGREARALGAIPAWDMSIESMTVKLGWLLGQKLSYEEINAKMLTSLKGEIVAHK